MRIKNFVNYSVRGGLKSYLIYFGVVFLVMHLILIMNAITHSTGGFGGMDSATVIFMFVVGITYYKEDISMAIQNGISRKTYYLSVGIVFTLLALVGSLGDTLLCIIGETYGNNIEGFEYASTYEQLYLMEGYEIATSTVGDYFIAFVLQATDNLFALVSGLFISSLVYILPKALKFIIPATLYGTIFIVGPILDYALFDNAIFKSLIKVYNWTKESGLNMSLLSIMAAVVLYAISYLFIRRVNIADRK